jgi:hypothetical protein
VFSSDVSGFSGSVLLTPGTATGNSLLLDNQQHSNQALERDWARLGRDKTELSLSCWQERGIGYDACKIFAMKISTRLYPPWISLSIKNKHRDGGMSVPLV